MKKFNYGRQDGEKQNRFKNLTGKSVGESTIKANHKYVENMKME